MKRAHWAVLIIEDNRTMAELFHELLEEQEGILVSEAHTLEEADTAMQQISFDQVLVDAEVDGPIDRTVSFLQRIKAHGFHGQITAISGQPQNNAVLCQHGADAGFVKTEIHSIIGAVFSPA